MPRGIGNFGERRCVECGKPFQALRIKQVYDSPNCKQKAYNRRVKASRVIALPLDPPPPSTPEVIA